MNTTETSRKALAGRCSTCDQRTLRGPDQHGQIVVASLTELDAAAELRAWSAGTATYRLTWVGHMQLDIRTAHDLAIDPAGFRAGVRIYPAHRCPDPEGNR